MQTPVIRIERIRTLARGLNDMGAWATVGVSFRVPEPTLYAATIAAARDEAIRVGRIEVGDPIGQEVSTGLNANDEFWQMNVRVQGFVVPWAKHLGSDQVRTAEVNVAERDHAPDAPRPAGKTRTIVLE